MGRAILAPGNRTTYGEPMDNSPDCTLGLRESSPRSGKAE
jgi:hypothetical protein